MSHRQTAGSGRRPPSTYTRRRTNRTIVAALAPTVPAAAAGVLPQHAPSYLSCNICLDAAKVPVVTDCGHLFCWPCLYRWVHAHSPHRDCPVCKSVVEVDAGIATVTPIYGPDGEEGTRLQEAAGVPPRPPGRRRDRTQGPYGRAPLPGEVREVVDGLRSVVQWIESVVNRMLTSSENLEGLVARLWECRWMWQTGGARHHRQLEDSAGQGVAGSRGSGGEAMDHIEDGVFRRTRRRLANQ